MFSTSKRSFCTTFAIALFFLSKTSMGQCYKVPFVIYFYSNGQNLGVSSLKMTNGDESYTLDVSSGHNGTSQQYKANDGICISACNKVFTVTATTSGGNSYKVGAGEPPFNNPTVKCTGTGAAIGDPRKPVFLYQ